MSENEHLVRESKLLRENIEKTGGNNNNYLMNEKNITETKATDS